MPGPQPLRERLGALLVASSRQDPRCRLGWREPLCLFVAVGMDAGAPKSSVFTAMTRPVAEFERQQATAALPGITETATLRRLADQAAAAADAAAGKAPANQTVWPFLQVDVGPEPTQT